MKIIRWVIGAVILISILVYIMGGHMQFLSPPGLPYFTFLSRALYVILLAGTMCIWRVFLGPTGADRIVAIDILGILIIGLCSILTISTGRTWYLDIAMAWALQSFISVLAFSKFLEGRSFDE
ncbi:MAG: multiple resistance and pH regulation protein F [Candidatus Omnitrophica bacterium]|nr:multiple resistance and pH regulation protein F [Candidatus Omnitrophota bacterium]